MPLPLKKRTDSQCPGSPIQCGETVLIAGRGLGLPRIENAELG